MCVWSNKLVRYIKISAIMEDIYFFLSVCICMLVDAYKANLGKTDLSPWYNIGLVFTSEEDKRERDEVADREITSLSTVCNLHSGYRFFGWIISFHSCQQEDKQVSLLSLSIRYSAFHSLIHWGYSPLGQKLYTKVLLETPLGAGLGFRFIVLCSVQIRTQDFQSSWFHLIWGTLGNPWLCMRSAN